VESLAREWAGLLKVVKVNVDNERPLAAQFNVTATPMFILYRHGIRLADVSGALPQGQLEAWLRSFLR
jgi:thioredoxin-like negative regulator of GroEL